MPDMLGSGHFKGIHKTNTQRAIEARERRQYAQESVASILDNTESMYLHVNRVCANPLRSVREAAKILKQHYGDLTSGGIAVGKLAAWTKIVKSYREEQATSGGVFKSYEEYKRYYYASGRWENKPPYPADRPCKDE